MPGAGGDDVVGGVGLVDPELPAELGGHRRDQPGAGARADQDARRSPPAAARPCPAPPRRPAARAPRAAASCTALLDAGLGADLVGAHRRPVVGACCGSGRRCVHTWSPCTAASASIRGMHGEAPPHVDRRDTAAPAGGTPGARRRARGSPPARSRRRKSRTSLVARVEGDHVVVVPEVAGLRPAPPATGPTGTGCAAPWPTGAGPRARGRPRCSRGCRCSRRPESPGRSAAAGR